MMMMMMNKNKIRTRTTTLLINKQMVTGKELYGC